MIVAIVGAGNMARGIGTRAAAGGHSVRLHDRNKAKAVDLAATLSQATPGAEVTAVDADAAADADIVVLALPHPAGRDLRLTRRTPRHLRRRTDRRRRAGQSGRQSLQHHLRRAAHRR
ncbi:NAD(P)-binding domain-containing protein [Streptomyces sp. DSM 118148]|uniref:NAD(P)-binding domain-containing protein n=1 Tax=Streptomyces sp. DSM 118148 TaxID=3448667 RepID=UPI00403FD231